MSSPQSHLAKAFTTLWLDENRARTLGRLAQHERAIERWWQCELAAHLWDHAEHFGDDVYVGLEAHDRADIILGSGTEAGGTVTFGGQIIIPIELKMVGTFWTGGPARALEDPTKKGLAQDLAEAAERRDAKPFAAVALLVTHKGARTDALFEKYLAHARELAERHDRRCVLDEAIDVRHDADFPSAAHQFLWTSS